MGIGSLIGGVVGAAGSIFGGSSASDASKDAAAQQAAGQQAGLDWQKQVYGETKDNLQPWIGGGQSALQNLLSFFGIGGSNGASGGAQQGFQQFTNTPFYQFPLQQSQLALNRSLASSGLNQSGGALRAGTQLASGYASQGLSQYLSGLQGLSSGGQNAAGALGGLANTAAQNVANSAAGVGNAQAAGTIGANNAMNSGIQGALPAINNLGQSAYKGVSNLLNPDYGGTSQPSYIDSGSW